MTTKFSDLEKEGYEGQDNSLEISLYQYGLVWKEDGDDIKFIYGVELDEDFGEAVYKTFDWSNIGRNVDPFEEWSWADWDAVCRYTGMNTTYYKVAEIPLVVCDLVSYYGTEEIFGTSYYPFEIEMDNDCKCGNIEMGFDCVCDHVKNNPGNINYVCEFCGIYRASKPQCNKCEMED